MRKFATATRPQEPKQFARQPNRLHKQRPSNHRYYSEDIEDEDGIVQIGGNITQEEHIRKQEASKVPVKDSTMIPIEDFITHMAYN